MTIQSIRLANFRGFADATISFGQHTLIKGDNKAGKSTILYALAWCLTKACALTARDGKNYAGLIREGETVMKVEVQIEGLLHPIKDWSVARTRSLRKHTLEVTGIETTKPAAADVLLTEKLGLAPEVLAVLLDPCPFTLRDAKQQADALSRILQPSSLEVPPEVRKLGYQEIPGVDRLAEITKEVKTVKLTDANLVLKSLKDNPVTEPEEPEGLEGVEIEMGELYEQRSILEQEKQNYAAQSTTAKTKLEALSEQFDCEAEVCPVRKRLGERVAGQREALQREYEQAEQDFVSTSGFHEGVLSKIEVQETQHKALKDHQQAVETYQRYLAEQEAALDKVVELKSAVDALDRLKADFVGDKITEFLAEINAFCRDLPMPEIAYSWKEGFTAHGRPLEQWLSEGQSEAMFEPAFRVAAAKVTGLGVVVMDHRAPVSHRVQVAVAKALGRSGCQIIQTFTTGERKPPKPGSPMTMYWVEGEPATVEGLEAVQEMEEVAV